MRPGIFRSVLTTTSLEEEKAAWEALAALPTPPALPPIPTTTPTFADIDASLLDSQQASILATLQILQTPQPAESSSEPSPSTFTFTTPAALQAHLENLSLSVEPNIDLFADGVHKIEQYRNTAERVADRVLGTASKRLEERDKESKEKVGSEGIGVGDVLRGLAGVLKES
jgi:kinetochore protein Mis13/DSN1